MNNEIKEILDILKKCKDYDDEVYLIKQHGATLLLDYITKLQEDIRTEQEINSELQQENERLKELCDKYEEEHSNEFKIWKEERHELLDYKSRCEKASAELKNWKKLDLDNLLVAIRRTQNILQNGSDSQ